MVQLYNWHWLSIVIKVILGFVVFLLSAILSYAFFTSIEPPNMAIFPFAALSLTEGGVVGWVAIFTCQRHHRVKGLIALLMIFASVVTTLVITFAELIAVFQDHSLVNSTTVQNGTLILLEVMLGLHILAVVSDFLVGKIEWLLSDIMLHKNVTSQEVEPALVPLPVASPSKNGKNGVGNIAAKNTQP